MASALRILLLEDDPTDAELVRETLRDEGVEGELVETCSAEEFRQQLGNGTFDLLLCDANVHGYTGLEALREARSQDSHLAVIFVTGSIGEAGAVAALRAGATDIVFKHQLSRLGPAVRRAVAERRQRLALDQAQEAVRASEERFRGLVENSSDAILMLDPQGRVLYVSPAAERIVGYSPEERMGRETFEVIHPDDVALVRAMLARCLADDSSLHRWELRVKHKEGHWVQIECVAANRLANPAIRALVLNYRDVTERQRLEDMLRQAQKMEAIGRVAGGIAHDFNNLVGVTIGYSDLILKRMPEGDPVRPKLMEIRKAGERAASLTQQLMAFSRKRAPLAEKLELGAVVSNLADMLHRVLGEDVQLVLRLDPACGRVRADRTQMEQVLMNLVVNARDAMPTGGRLVIECRDVELERPTPLRTLAAAGPYVMLSVSDTGVGMDPEVQEHVFEPFFTTKPVGQGTGLGLATVYGIVNQSGGHISVYSEPGRGTTFKIYLPRLGEAGERLAPSAQLPPAGGGSETILLVEDAEALRRMTREVLEASGYYVLEAAQGEEALRLAGSHQGRIDMVLTDLVMPDMTGRELAGWLRITDSNVKVLYMSGYTDQAATENGQLASGSAFLQKPFAPEELLRRIRDVLDAAP